MRRLTVLIFLAVALASHVHAQEDPDVNLPFLLAYYPLSSNALAVAGTNDGVVYGQAVFNEDSILLNGTDTHVAFGPSLSVTGSLSLSIWLNPADDRLMRVAGKWKQEEDQREYAVFLNNGYIWCCFSDGSVEPGHAFLKVSLLPAVITQEWNHVVMTWDASLGSSGLALYVDGEALLTAGQVLDLHAVNPGSAELSLGAYDLPALSSVEGPSSPSAPLARRSLGEGGGAMLSALPNLFQGRVSQLALFRGVLSETEVQDLHSLGRVGNLMPHLAEYLPDAPINSEQGAEHTSSQAQNPSSSPASVLRPPSSVVRSGILYIDCHTGDDSFDGAHPIVANRAAKQGPKKTISAALRSAQDGDTVYVAGGEYTESVRNSKVRMIATGRVILK